MKSYAEIIRSVSDDMKQKAKDTICNTMRKYECRVDYLYGMLCGFVEIGLITNEEANFYKEEYDKQR